MDKHEVARMLLEKVNNGPIEKITWEAASEYSRQELKRKALITMDLVFLLLDKIENKEHIKDAVSFFKDVEEAIDKFNG